MLFSKNSKIRKVLLQPRFQLTFVVINWLCMLFTAVVCYYLITSTFNDLSVIGQKMNLSSDSGYMRFLRSQERLFISRLMVYLPIALFIGFIVTVFMSHKVASPIYKIRKYFRNLDWKNPTLLYFRDEDYFSDLAITINKSLKITHRIEKAHSARGKGDAGETNLSMISQNDVDKLLRETLKNLNALSEGRAVQSGSPKQADGQKTVRKKVKKVIRKKVIKRIAPSGTTTGLKKKIVKKKIINQKVTQATSDNIDIPEQKVGPVVPVTTPKKDTIERDDKEVQNSSNIPKIPSS